MTSPKDRDDETWNEARVARFLSEFRDLQPRTPEWLRAEQVLLAIPAEHAPLLIDAFDQAPKEVEHALRGALSKIGSTAYYDLIGALRHASVAARLNSIELLYGIAQLGDVILSDSVVELGQVLVSDPDPRIRRHAAATLEQIGVEAEMAVGELRQALSDQEPQVREWAALALGAIGDRSKEALAELTECLLDDSPSVRDAASRAIDKLNNDLG